VSSPSDQQPPGEPERRGPSTQEIPVVPGGATATGSPAGPLPPHPGAVPPAPVAMGEAQPTGPVGFVPGPPPGPQAQPATQPATQSASAPEPASEPAPAGAAVWPDTLESDLLGSGEGARREKVRRVGAPRDRAAVLGLGLAVLALVLLELGLALRFGSESYWSAVPLWSAFATLCAVLGVVAFAVAFRAGGTGRSGTVWRLAAAGLVGLAVFWVLVVLSVVASDRGFLLTAPLGALGAALWTASARKG
jgi:hypothetical protein